MRTRASVILTSLALSAACASAGPRSPERLRDDYVVALKKNDAKEAYALLSPELRAEVSAADFESRWKSNAAERAEAVEAGASVPDNLRGATRMGTTAHDGGEVLYWAVVDDQHYVVDGLPGTPTTATPGQTIRALIVAVRTTDLSAIRSLLGDDLAHAIDEDWAARVEAMEAALDRPGSIELSTDLRRAELSYEPGRVLTLEQTARGWRITSLE